MVVCSLEPDPFRVLGAKDSGIACAGKRVILSVDARLDSGEKVGWFMVVCCCPTIMQQACTVKAK
jgi:hypothetical protein